MQRFIGELAVLTALILVLVISLLLLHKRNDQIVAKRVAEAE